MFEGASYGRPALDAVFVQYEGAHWQDDSGQAHDDHKHDHVGRVTEIRPIPAGASAEFDM